ncbi:MAG: hypothetical protein IKJ25_04665 [Clostridia bacterium]|nr:hypothetical protein [Clostridia bacterium]
MKKTIIKTISVLLTFVLLMLALSSCDLIFGSKYDLPEGYTGGFPGTGGFGAPEIEYCWVETYDECLAAIEKLESHGSEINKALIFCYEGELFDTKYCFTFNREKADKIVFGEDPFDRYAENVHVHAYAFLKDVEIDELIFSDVNNYDCCGFNGLDVNYADALSKNPDLSDNDFEIRTKRYYSPEGKDENVNCLAKYDDVYICEMYFEPTVSDDFAETAFRKVVDSLVIVGNKSNPS